MNAEIKVDGKSYKVIGTCSVLWSGWDCDETCWAVETESGVRLVGSDHGSKRFYGAEFLLERICAYENAIEESETLLAMLTE